MRRRSCRGEFARFASRWICRKTRPAENLRHKATRWIKPCTPLTSSPNASIGDPASSNLLYDWLFVLKQLLTNRHHWSPCGLPLCALRHGAQVYPRVKWLVEPGSNDSLEMVRTQGICISFSDKKQCTSNHAHTGVMKNKVFKDLITGFKIHSRPIFFSPFFLNFVLRKFFNISLYWS